MRILKTMMIFAFAAFVISSCNQKEVTTPTTQNDDSGNLKNAPYCGFTIYTLYDGSGNDAGTLEIFNATSTTYFTFTPTNFDPNAVVTLSVNGSNYTNFYSVIRPTSIRSYVDGLGPCVNSFTFTATIGNLTASGSYTFECCCWGDSETAWSAGSRYTQRGNWATYTPYTIGQTITKTLLAGKTNNAGSVKFEPDGNNVKITVTMTGNWGFNPDETENVKIQDYAVAPSGNPAPGQFAYKYFAENAKPSPYKYIAIVPANNFYGVHIDVVQGIVCEGDEE